MFFATDTLPLPRHQRNAALKKMGVQYWQRLCRVGIPAPEARQIAAAIAKYDLAQRPPKPDHACLIQRYSALICRAELWRRSLLLPPAAADSQPPLTRCDR